MFGYLCFYRCDSLIVITVLEVVSMSLQRLDGIRLRRAERHRSLCYVMNRGSGVSYTRYCDGFSGLIIVAITLDDLAAHLVALPRIIIRQG